MSIQYKFRSSVNFKTVEIGNRASISIGELRSRIMQNVFSKHQGFDDLIFYDAVSGLEFESDASEIPSGSSVIVKRVPGRTAPSIVLPKKAVNHAAMESRSLNALNGPINDVNVLGVADTKQEFDQTGLRLECKNLKPSEVRTEQSNTWRLPKSNVAVQKKLECSICFNILKDAVMVPCCQHSFCLKCIRGKGMCPICFSRKCSTRDLIPNLSLRGAISHFLKSQMLDVDLKNKQEDVPDRESGTSKKVSRVLAVVRRELELPESPCASETGSNEADCSIKRGGGFWIGSRGGGRNLLGPGGHKKGVRNCYTCGSPYHLMRDCPITHSNSIFQPGSGVPNGGMLSYAASYWNGPSVPPVTPNANWYNNSAVMPSNASLVPVPPSAVPPHIPSLHGSLYSPGVYMTRSNMELPCPEHFGLQQCGHKRKHS